MTRSDLKKFAQTRLREARILAESRAYSGSYYLCGYVVECGLKACIARKTRKSEFPDKNAANASHTHDLITLINLAGLGPVHNDMLRNNPNFNVNWGVVKDWKEDSRYELHSEKEATDLYKAVSEENNGVLKWIKNYW